MDFLVRRDDLRRCTGVASEPAPLEAGQARLAIEAFGLSTNNVTYAVLGDAVSYWRFFPAPDGWGRVPVWGYATVAESRSEAAPDGARVFGYLPPSAELVVTPGDADRRRFVDASPHRAGLPGVYNGYVHADEDRSLDDHRMLLRPLLATSYLIGADLKDHGFHGARLVVLSSASSKTALGTAFMLRRQGGAQVVGLTSSGRRAFVEGLGVYDRVVRYEDVEELPAEPAVFVDIAGDAAVRESVHRHFGDALKFSSLVGATHREALGGAQSLPGPDPVMFFAPSVVERRGGLGAEAAAATAAALEWAGGWLRVERGSGQDAVERAWLTLVDGGSDPAAGYVLSLRA
jgi:hypothetical protein